MVSNSQNRWALRAATLVLWGLVAASASYWGLKLFARPASLVAPPVARPVPVADPAAVARLLGFSPQAVLAAPVVSVASRFALVGVVAAQSRWGAALIAIDGKPARPFRVGSPVDEGLWLLSVEGRRATLAASADGPGVVTLELPPLRQ